MSPKMSARYGLARKKNFPAPFGAIPSHFLHGPKKIQKKNPKPQILLGGSMGPIRPVWANRQHWYLPDAVITISIFRCMSTSQVLQFSTANQYIITHKMPKGDELQEKANAAVHQCLPDAVIYVLPHLGWIAARANTG